MGSQDLSHSLISGKDCEMIGLRAGGIGRLVSGHAYRPCSRNAWLSPSRPLAIASAQHQTSRVKKESRQLGGQRLPVGAGVVGDYARLI